MTAPTSPTRAAPKGYQAPATKYEHRLNPDDAREVQVRPVTYRPMGNHDRGASWRRYMRCSSPAAALRILSMLAPEADGERESVVTK